MRDYPRSGIPTYEPLTGAPYPQYTKALDLNQRPNTNGTGRPGGTPPEEAAVRAAVEEVLTGLLGRILEMLQKRPDLDQSGEVKLGLSGIALRSAARRQGRRRR